MTMDEIMYHLKRPEIALDRQEVGERYSHLVKAAPTPVVDEPEVEHVYGEDEEGLPVIITTLDKPLNETAVKVLEAHVTAPVVDDIPDLPTVAPGEPLNFHAEVVNEVLPVAVVIEDEFTKAGDAWVSGDAWVYGDAKVSDFDEVHPVVETAVEVVEPVVAPKVVKKPSWADWVQPSVAEAVPHTDAVVSPGRSTGKRGPKQTYDVSHLAVNEFITHPGPLSTARVLASIRQKDARNIGKAFRAKEDGGKVIIFRLS